MVYPRSRSMNADLNEGATDGKYKKVVQDRENSEFATYESREDLRDVWYGIHEQGPKVIPGKGTIASTPNYVATRRAEEDF